MRIKSASLNVSSPYRLRAHDLSRAPSHGPCLEAQDLIVGLGALAYAVFSLIWPGTDTKSLPGGIQTPRGYPTALAFFCMAAFALLVAPRISPGRGFASFARRFYPQAFYPFFFMEGILLSGQALGGYSHDALFAAADQAIFGFQPSIEFSRAFSHIPLVNEIMFGAYFAFYVVLALTPWIAWFKGDEQEARRQIFDFSAIFVLLGMYYVFFRVQGPKYWFPELSDAGYGSIKGGVFVSFFQKAFERTTLSGSAFPSSHVLISVVSLRAAYRMDRRLLFAYLPLVCLIALATVYIYAHYAVDAIAGAILALALAPLVERAMPRLEALCASAKLLGIKARR